MLIQKLDWVSFSILDLRVTFVAAVLKFLLVLFDRGHPLLLRFCVGCSQQDVTGPVIQNNQVLWAKTNLFLQVFINITFLLNFEYG